MRRRPRRFWLRGWEYSRPKRTGEAHLLFNLGSTFGPECFLVEIDRRSGLLEIERRRYRGVAIRHSLDVSHFEVLHLVGSLPWSVAAQRQGSRPVQVAQ